MFKKSLFILATVCMFVLSACTDSAKGLAVIKVLSAAANGDNLIITTNATKLDPVLLSSIVVDKDSSNINLVKSCTVDAAIINCKLSELRNTSFKYYLSVMSLKGYINDLRAYQEVSYSTEFPATSP